MVITARIHSNLTNEAHAQLCEVNKISSYARWEQESSESYSGTAYEDR